MNEKGNGATPQGSVESIPRAESSDEGDLSDRSSSSTDSLREDDVEACRPTDPEMPSLSKVPTREDAAPGLTLARTISRRDTILSRIRSRPVPVFSHPLAHQPTGPSQLVDFDGPDDVYRPMNWPTHKKVVTTMIYGMVTMTATWASAAYSAGTVQVAQEFGVGTQTATLGTTLFLFGFGLGPLLWAPLSEVYGRRLAVLLPMVVAICFTFGSATAKDIQTLMLTRFFGAFFASAPVTNTGGVLGDLYSPAWRGIALAGYAMAVVGGPAIGQ